MLIILSTKNFMDFRRCDSWSTLLIDCIVCCFRCEQYPVLLPTHQLLGGPLSAASQVDRIGSENLPAIEGYDSNTNSMIPLVFI